MGSQGSPLQPSPKGNNAISIIHHANLTCVLYLLSAYYRGCVVRLLEVKFLS